MSSSIADRPAEGLRRFSCLVTRPYGSSRRVFEPGAQERFVTVRCIGGQENRRLDGKRNEFAARFTALSPRERQVMHLVADGRNLKQIALELDISIQTAAKHRARMLEKIGVNNDVELARMAGQFGATEAVQAPVTMV